MDGGDVKGRSKKTPPDSNIDGLPWIVLSDGLPIIEPTGG